MNDCAFFVGWAYWRTRPPQHRPKVYDGGRVRPPYKMRRYSCLHPKVEFAADNSNFVIRDNPLPCVIWQLLPCISLKKAPAFRSSSCTASRSICECGRRRSTIYHRDGASSPRIWVVLGNRRIWDLSPFRQWPTTFTSYSGRSALCRVFWRDCRWAGMSR